MKLNQLGVVLQASLIAFGQDFKPSGIFDSNEEEYYVGKLLEPIQVRCSTMKEMEAIEVDELYVRKEHALGEGWEPINKEEFEKLQAAGKASEYKGGFHIPGWKADFSKNQMVAIYQPETIAAWARGKRKESKEEGNKSFLDKIKERRAQAAGN